MQLQSRVAEARRPQIATHRGPVAVGAPAKASLAGDTLTRSSGKDTTALASLREAQALDAAGDGIGSFRRFNLAIDEAETVETLLLVRDALANRKSSGGKTETLRLIALNRADELATAQHVTSATGDAAARAYAARAAKMRSLELSGAADYFFTKAIEEAQSFETAIEAVKTVGGDAVNGEVGARVAELAAQAEVTHLKGDAAAKAYTNLAQDMDDQGLVDAADQFYRRAADAAESREGLEAIIRQFYRRDDPGIHQDAIKPAESKLRRLDTPFRWWNPFTW